MVWLEINLPKTRPGAHGSPHVLHAQISEDAVFFGSQCAPPTRGHSPQLPTGLTSPSNGKTIVYNTAPNTSTQAQSGRVERSLRLQDLHWRSEWRLL